MTVQKRLLGVVGLITGRYLRVQSQGVPCTGYVYRNCVGFLREGGEQVIVFMQFRKYEQKYCPLIIATIHT